MCNASSYDSLVKSVCDKYDVEVWKEIGVIEITKDNTSVDMEIIPVNRWDEFCKAYIEDLRFDCMYQVSVGKGADIWVNELFEMICKETGGRFCADTDDLTPYIE